MFNPYTDQKQKNLRPAKNIKKNPRKKRMKSVFRQRKALERKDAK